MEPTFLTIRWAIERGSFCKDFSAWALQRMQKAISITRTAPSWSHDQYTFPRPFPPGQAQAVACIRR